MVDFKVAMNTTLLLVDDDFEQLELLGLVLQTSGFSVISAVGALQAMSITAQPGACRADVAVIEYHQPVVNGCVLAAYLRCRYPDMRIILYSGTIEIPESEMSDVDVFVPKGDGIGMLLARVSEFATICTTAPDVLGHEA